MDITPEHYLALGIFLLIAIVSLVIYARHPNTKFSKAEQLLEKRRFSEARKILQEIFEKHPLAVTKYAESYLIQGQELYSQGKTNEALEKYSKVIHAKTLITPKSNADSYLIVKNAAYYGISTVQFDNIPDSNTKETIDDYQKNLGFIKTVSSGDSIQFKELINKHHLKIGSIYFQIGLQEERDDDILAAISKYTHAKNTFNAVGEDQKYCEAITRVEICKLKIKESPNSENIDFITKVAEHYQADFFYRFALYHIDEKEFKEAEDIVNERLNSEDESVQELLNICHNEKLRLAITEVEEINEQIKNLYTESTSNDEAISLYNTISEKADRLNIFIPEIKDELENLKPSLFNRALVEYYETNEFGKIINLIKDYPEFYKSPVLMKNLGNSCINYLRNNTITENDYKMFMSLFLTSAYSDNVMLYSLEETQWDDEYTFSLSDSIGSSYEIHNTLPDNVNYDDITETNISIGESQRFLISQFEALLNEQELDSDLLKEVHDFYDSEKKAIEGIISVIPNEITFCTPYFAKQFKIADTIIDELENDYSDYENDESLEFGISYLFNSRDCRVNEYKEAKKTLLELTKSIKKTDLNRFQNSLTEGRKELLLKFDGIRQAIEPTLSEGFNDRISKSSMDENLIPLMKEAIRLSPSNDKLKYQYANFTSILCVSKINEGEISNFRGLQIMSDSYSLLPNDQRVCTNIIALIRMNILDVLSDRGQNSRKIYSILDKIKNNRSNSFKSNAGELIKARNEIIEQLPSDARIAILSGLNLNPHGEKLKKGLDYLAELGGSSSVKDPLAALKEQLGLNLDFPF
jgi:hypothetical protein